MAYLGEYNEWKNAFNQVANALVPGGYFLVDLMNFYGMIKGYKAPELRKYNVDDKQITVFVNHEIDLKNSHWIHQMNIIIDDGQFVQHYVDEHKLTMISLGELLFHVQQTSLEQVHYFTSYEGRPGEPMRVFV
ncbi:MAG: hypothetical protein IH840_01090 [Candidatus Heimdallarchaeota archaeon]|nr:hypothetical protein [Candidatus Heimdallarchaeota archaeon]